MRFVHPQKAGERNFFHPVSHNPWEVMISGPVWYALLSVALKSVNKYWAFRVLVGWVLFDLILTFPMSARRYNAGGNLKGTGSWEMNGIQESKSHQSLRGIGTPWNFNTS